MVGDYINSGLFTMMILTFGFLDPKHVLRGVHFMPAASCGRTQDDLGPSVVRRRKDNDSDYRYYFVGM